MTNEEALEHFTRRKTQLGLSDNIQQAENCAITALEKQIPKKPIKYYFIDKYQRENCYYLCPNLFPTFWEVKNNMHFCPKCGQALDWSDSE